MRGLSISPAAALPVVVALAAGTVPGQLLPMPVPDGYQGRVAYIETGSPFAMNGFAVDPGTGDLFVAVLNEILAVDSRGKRTLVHRWKTGEVTGLIGVPPGSRSLYFTNFTTSRFYRRDLRTGLLTSVAGLKNSFDVAETGDGQILVAANPNWPRAGSNTGIWRMDLAQGRHREVVRLAGPSGPLVLDPAGNLLCALQPSTFPPPKGAVQVVSFTAARLKTALAGGKPLTMGQGRIVLRGLDAALDLAFDDRGRLYISDPVRGGLLRTSPGSFNLEPRPFIQRSKLTTLGMQFVKRAAASMDAWQPTGARLFVATSDWSNTGEVRRIEPRRPGLAATPKGSVPKGKVRLELSRAPRNAAVWLVVTAGRLFPVEVKAFTQGGVTAWLALDLTMPFAVLNLRTNSAGVATLDTTNPGGAHFTLHLQALAASSPAVFGTSNPLSLVIQR